jgi:hypothetical protein
MASFIKFIPFSVSVWTQFSFVSVIPTVFYSCHIEKDLLAVSERV